jgi:hypothetical protein
MPVRPLYPPPMNFVPHPLRRAAQPFVFAGAIGLGIWLWLKLGDFSLARCPPDLVWYGGASGDKKCSWPLVVYLAKDIVGAALTGALPVLLCAAMAPANKVTTARIAAIGTSALALLYMLVSTHSLRPAALVVAVGVTSAASPWLAALLVAQAVRPSPRVRC